MSEFTITQSPGITGKFQAGAGNPVSSTGERESEANRAGWERIINLYLIEWGRNPARLEEPDLLAPSLETIKNAGHIAMCLRDLGWSPPTRVVPDGEGGIAFELVASNYYQSLVVSANGGVELDTFRDCRFVSRVPLCAPQSMSA